MHSAENGFDSSVCVCLWFAAIAMNPSEKKWNQCVPSFDHSEHTGSLIDTIPPNVFTNAIVAK